MNKLRLLAVLAATILLAGLLGACGDDEDAASKEEYASAVQAVLDPLGENLQQLGDTLSSSEDAGALAQGLAEVQRELERGVESLEAITPPEDVEQVHEDLIAALGDFSGELDATREAAEDEDLEALQEAALELPDRAQEFATEMERIQQAAIDAGVPIEEPDTPGEEPDTSSEE